MCAHAAADSGDPALTGLAERLLGSAGARWWLAVDVSFRRITWCDPPGSTPFVRRVHGELSLLGLVLAACERDGHVREPAVARLADVFHPAVLPVLALRSTDWVAQVRDRARLACQRRLERTPPG